MRYAFATEECPRLISSRVCPQISRFYKSIGNPVWECKIFGPAITALKMPAEYAGFILIP
jgi:hypothetical protein